MNNSRFVFLQIHRYLIIIIFIEKGHVTDKKSDRIQKNQRLFKLEMSVHKNDLGEAKNCIKNNLEYNNAKVLIEDAEPGILRNYFSLVEDFLEYLERNSTTYWILHKFALIMNVYVDIVKGSFQK